MIPEDDDPRSPTQARGGVVGEHAAPGWSIEPARAGDERRIAEIWRVGWGDGHLGNVPDELFRHRSGESFLPRARERLAKTRVARIGGSVVGFAMVNGDEVEQVYVRPNRPRNGDRRSPAA